MAKPAFKFFTSKRRRGTTVLFLRGNEKASLWMYDGKWVAGRADIYGFEDGFDTAEQAEEFVWRHWV